MVINNKNNIELKTKAIKAIFEYIEENNIYLEDYTTYKSILDAIDNQDITEEEMLKYIDWLYIYLIDNEEKINIHSSSIIGLNTGVIKNITEPGTYIGTPAKKIK
jgi:hypothetical protein